MPLCTAEQWNSFLAAYPESHILQTPAWGVLKSAFGWDAAYLIVEEEGKSGAGGYGAQLLFRHLPLGYSIAYIPKGPIGAGPKENWHKWRAFWDEVDAICRQRKAIFLKVEPDIWGPSSSGPTLGADTAGIVKNGFRRSQQDIQPARTLLVDLDAEEDQLLARMKQKTRYNIRLAAKKGVVVRTSSDLGAFHRLMLQTGERDTFGVHSYEYYRRAYENFHPQGLCEVLVAEYEEELLAALMVFAYGSRAWYFYGASSSAHRQRMPTYILQWEAMRWARQRGCTTYDLWGVPDADEAALEADFTRRSDGLWGVYRFKRGFGGQLKRASGPWDRVYKPAYYAFFRWWANRRSGEPSAGEISA